uniref:Uncharacterized protein n=1 Tax=Anguilla anguilla TaxID=7936 RepID=A0A0E9RCY4_ANGAN
MAKTRVFVRRFDLTCWAGGSNDVYNPWKEKATKFTHSY